MKTPFLIIVTVFCACVFSASANAEHHKDRKHGADRAQHDQRNHRNHRDDRKETHHREHRRDTKHQSRHDRRQSHAHQNRHDRHRYDGRRSGGKHGNKHNGHHRDRSSDYFVGGLILGSLGHHNSNAYNSYHHHKRGEFAGGHRVSFWRDRHGQCFRVEHRRRGKLYVEVPRYKCY